MRIFTRNKQQTRAVWPFMLSAALFLAFIPLIGKAQSAYERAYSMYAKGEVEYALIIWENAAETGNSASQYVLGLLNFRNDIPGASLTKALKYFEMAAERGHIGASYNLGIAYLNGTGTAFDDLKAIQYLTKAAEHGHASAQYNLGLMYYQGTQRGTRDKQLGLKWLTRASSNGHKDALVMVSAIEKRNQALAANKAKLAEQGDVNVNKAAEIYSDLIVFTHSGSEQIELRHRPSGIVFGYLPRNSEWVVIEKVHGWLAIAPKAGMPVWVYSRYVKVDADTSVGKIIAEGVRGRPLPSVDNSKSPPIGLFFTGESLELLDRQIDWIRLRAPLRFTVWIRESDFVLVGDNNEIPDSRISKVVSAHLASNNSERGSLYEM